MLAPGVAAGHPATADAGLELLEAGGSAADAAVAACLASCVAETVMTGLLGGGHAIYWDAASGTAENLDCFVAVPGLGAEPSEAELVHLEVPFGTELVHYAIGPASCGVPGLPAGLGALWERHGRLAWRDLFEPARRLARDGVDFPSAHAECLEMLAPVMTMDAGARIYAPGGRLLEAGATLRQPGLDVALGLLADEGASSAYTGSLGEALLGLVADRGGLVTEADLRAYTARWSEPVRVPYLEGTLLTRADLSGLPETVPRLPRLRGASEPARAVELARTLDGEGPDGHTTNLVTVDEQGNTCVLTTSLGLGSGDFVPGLDLHLNSMLGEVDLVRGRLDPGARMASMMAPTLALDGDGPTLATGAAGGTRLRSALLQVIVGVLDEGLDPERAVDRPRLHPAGGVVHLEPGFDPGVAAALEAAGLEVRNWTTRHHYFGGVSAITRSGGVGDPRRNGAARSPR
jgi:gamma-glutamyltranspeptidase/glutathione hydrolase